LNILQHPALVPVVLLAAALLATLLPGGWRRARLLAAATGCVLALVVVADVAPLTASGPLLPAFGDVVPGIPLTLRADPTGLALVVIAVAAALLALGAHDRRPGEEAAILITAVGAALAAPAANAVLLFAGVEIANLGGLLIARAARGRVSRGALVAFGLQHAFGLGLLAAAVQLIVTTGTSDPYALPPAAIGLAVALPWGLAGASRLLAPGWWPGAAGGRSTRAWLAVGGVPCGGAILLRLVAGLDGADEPALTIMLCAVGAAAALAGAVAAWRWQGDAGRAGRALLVAAAGPVVVLAGVPGGTGAFVAGLVALELAVIAAPAWSGGPGTGRLARAMAATALAAAGGLPIGFGTTALVLELGTVASVGRPYAPLLLALGAAALMAAGAGLAAARRALGGGAGEPRTGRPRLDAATGLVLGGLAALLPGVVVELLLLPLVGGAAPVAVDLASLTAPGAAWPGGYLSLALMALILAVGCAAALLGLAVPRPGHGGSGHFPRSVGLTPLRLRRSAGPALRTIGRALAATDSWLVTQPGLLFAVAVALAAILLFK
jgi:hypothetical protein